MIRIPLSEQTLVTAANALSRAYLVVVWKPQSEYSVQLTARPRKLRPKPKPLNP